MAFRISECECIIVFRKFREIEGTCSSIFTVVGVEKSENIFGLLACKLILDQKYTLVRSYGKDDIIQKQNLVDLCTQLRELC